jgi:SpoVK/Ycf46/Vps4 family AAA+-type ATPase
MNPNLQHLIQAVADNDIQKAKSYVKCIISADTAECNRYFRTNILNKLSTPTNNLLELPHNIKDMLSMEDVSVSFDEKRYIYDARDAEIIKKVLDIWKTNDQLTEYGIHYLNSILLHGVSGCGKTTLGRYIAYQAKLPFVYLNFSHLISSYLGSTGKNIADVFNYVSKIKCVLMLDEIDAIGMARGNGQEVGEMSRIVINLMQSLDRLDNGIIVIGATNRPDIIDKALKRRFGIQYELGLPVAAIRKGIAERYLSTIPGTVYDDHDLEEFAKSTEGLSCAALVNIIVSQIVKCLVNNEPVRINYLKEAC